jgi:hypothetical protein
MIIFVKNTTMENLKIKGVKLKKGEELIIYHPFCFCIKKITPNGSSALFVMPPKNKGIVTDRDYLQIYFEYKLCRKVKVGDWCEVGYIRNGETGGYKVLKIFKSDKKIY